jgi:hypothetical protein
LFANRIENKAPARDVSGRSGASKSSTESRDP